jgi:valyl-tRNA synthetase
VKPRAYSEHGPAPSGSAVAALRTTLSAVLRLLAPFLPFVTEEVWSWWPDEHARHWSVHRSGWPDPDRLRALAAADDTPLGAACAAISAIRKAKSQARLPMRAPVRLLTVTGPAGQLDALAAVLRDVQSAGHVARAELSPAENGETRYDVTL